MIEPGLLGVSRFLFSLPASCLPDLLPQWSHCCCYWVGILDKYVELNAEDSRNKFKQDEGSFDWLTEVGMLPISDGVRSLDVDPILILGVHIVLVAKSAFY